MTLPKIKERDSKKKRQVLSSVYKAKKRSITVDLSLCISSASPSGRGFADDLLKDASK